MLIYTSMKLPHTIKIKVLPFEESYDNPANNFIETEVTVFADTDLDGLSDWE